MNPGDLAAMSSRICTLSMSMSEFGMRLQSLEWVSTKNRSEVGREAWMRVQVPLEDNADIASGNQVTWHFPHTFFDISKAAHRVVITGFLRAL